MAREAFWASYSWGVMKRGLYLIAYDNLLGKMLKGYLAPKDCHLYAAEEEDGTEVPRKRAKGSHTAAQQGEQQHSEYQNIARLAQVRSRLSAAPNTLIQWQNRRPLPWQRGR